jgi:hypothetical protein
MLLDLPAEIINLITDHLSLPPKGSHQGPKSCPNFPHEHDRARLTLYDASKTSAGYESDVLHFAMADPYIAKCMEKSGRQIEVDATVVKGLGVVPCAPEEVRRMVKYVPECFLLYDKG